MSQTPGSCPEAAEGPRSGFALIQQWYADQCDGDWEHEFGVRVATLDNPGWTVEIDLQETDLEGCVRPRQRVDLPGGGWYFTESDGKRFDASCDPHSLWRVDDAFGRLVEDAGRDPAGH